MSKDKAANTAPMKPPETHINWAGSVPVATTSPDALCTIFGVADQSLATRLLAQIINALQASGSRPIDSATVDQALALVEDIKPRDALESMTAVMLIGAQDAAMECLRKASHPNQTPAGRALYLQLGLKAMRTSAMLLDSLNQGRGKGVTQRVIVERVNVGPGGQAVVGAVVPRD